MSQRPSGGAVHGAPICSGRICTAILCAVCNCLYAWCTAVKGVMQRTHRLCATVLEIIPVELDDVDACRTFSVTCVPDSSSLSLLCAVHNYLNTEGVHGARFEPDETNRRIVVVVPSIEGIPWHASSLLWW